MLSSGDTKSIRHVVFRVNSHVGGPMDMRAGQQSPKRGQEKVRPGRGDLGSNLSIGIPLAVCPWRVPMPLWASVSPSVN